MNSHKAIEPVDTKEELAQLAQVGSQTIARVKKIEQKATEDVKQQLEQGEMSIHEASHQRNVKF